VDGAAAVEKKMAVGGGGDAEAGAAGGPIHVLSFELRGRQAEISGGAENVVVAEIDEAFLLATGSTAGLAFESERFRHALIVSHGGADRNRGLLGPGIPSSREK
jgi:hypothetical protein